MLGSLMDRNFGLRREIFGDAVIGAANLKMVELAKSFGGEVLCYLPPALSLLLTQTCARTLTREYCKSVPFQAALSVCEYPQQHQLGLTQASSVLPEQLRHIVHQLSHKMVKQSSPLPDYIQILS